MKGLEIRGCVMRKRPFNTDLLRWMHRELVAKGGDRSGGRGSMCAELFSSCIFGFFFLLRISELGALKWEDMAVDSRGGKRFPPIRIKKPTTDIFRGGIARSLAAVDSALCPVETFTTWKEIPRGSGNGENCVSGCNLRTRVSHAMKMEDSPNVFSIRESIPIAYACGATAMYTQGVPLDVIQRWGRWKSLTLRNICGMTLRL